MKKGIVAGIAVILLAGLCTFAGCGGEPPAEAPNAEFSADNTHVTVGEEIYFSDQSAGNPTEWSWEFGDGETSDVQDPTHAYSAAGSYTVSLIVTNPTGSDTETKEDYIQVYEAVAAQFSVKTEVVVGQVITFTDQSTGSPTEWFWDFGDGETSDVQNPTYAYSAAGSYTVSLTVTNPAMSDTETKENLIQVSEEIAMPIEEIKEALAVLEGVGVEDIEIAFCEPATMEGDLFAVGAIVDTTKSIVFLYDPATHQITIEYEYVAMTGDEISALSCASKQTSKWTGNLIVPCDIVEEEGLYNFRYYDGYYSVLSRWSYGWGTVDIEELTVEWGAHTT